MKKLIMGITFFSSVLLSTISCYAEQVALHFDNRQWELANKARNEEQGIAEFVLKGESLSNWRELVTAQVYFGLQEKTTPEAWMGQVINYIKSMYPDVKWSVIKKGDKDIIFEWELKNCPGQEDQHEISRVISGKKGIHVLHYVTKKLPFISEKRDKWIKLLDSATLEDS